MYHTGCPVTKPGKAGLNYVPNMEMALRPSAGQRSDLLAAMENADRAPGPDPIHIPSKQCGVESRLGYCEKRSLTFHVLLAKFLHIIRAARGQSKTQLNCCLPSPT